MSKELLRHKDRNKRIVNTFASSVATKGITLVCAYVSVPLAYGALGSEQFGLWMTITPILTALQFADLGIGNGLLNMVALSNAQGDRDGARRSVSSSVAILALLCIFILAGLSIAYPFIDWLKIYNVSGPVVAAEAGIATAIMVTCLALNMPLLTAQRVQMGYQDGLITNFWISLGSLMSLFGVLACSRMGGGLSAFMVAACGGPIVAAAICWAYEFCVARPWLFPSFRHLHLPTGRQVIKDGGLWTMFGLMAFIGTALDNVIISYYFGPLAASEYSIMAKLLGGLMVAQMLSAPLWPAFAEAIERGDLAWARRTFRRSMAICITLGLAGALIIAFLSQWIIQWWVGAELIPSASLVAGFSLWCFIVNFFAGISALMASQRFLPKLVRLTAAGAMVSFVLKLFLTPSVGPDFVVWASVIGYGIVCLPGVWMTRAFWVGSSLRSSI
jgi:O-antigen/teichoic acid export membrane protein